MTADHGTKSTHRSAKVHTFANGDRMDLLGLGTWKSSPGEVGNVVCEAIRIGYRHIDCASLYGNEAEVGKAVRDAIRDGEVTRKDLWITSKLWSNCHGRKNVAPQLEKGCSSNQAARIMQRGLRGGSCGAALARGGMPSTRPSHRLSGWRAT